MLMAMPPVDDSTFSSEYARAARWSCLNMPLYHYAIGGRRRRLYAGSLRRRDGSSAGAAEKVGMSVYRE